jgi:putative nucleotidyltransferase with HDIG domain
MANVPQKRTRQQRVATVELPPGYWGHLWGQLQRGSVLLRIGICAIAAILMLFFTRGWDPPFRYRLNQVPDRSIVASIDFEQPDQVATAEARKQARELTVAVYDQDPASLAQLRAELRLELDKLLTADTFDAVNPDLWQQFQPPLAEGTPDPTDEERAEQFERLKESLATETALETFDTKIAEAMAPLEEWGLLEELPKEHNGDKEKIFIRTREGDGFSAEAARNVLDVLIKNASAKLQQSLNEKLSSVELAQQVFAWLKPRLKPTLKLNQAATLKAQDAAAAAVEQVTKPFRAGEHTLVKGGKEIDSEDLKLLRLEHDARLAHRGFGLKLRRALAVLGMYLALYTLCGFYVQAREPRVLQDLTRFISLIVTCCVTVLLAQLVSDYLWGTEIIPILLLGMTITIAYQQEMALLITASVILVISIAIGLEFQQSLVLLATAAGAILVLKQVRTRGKLISVGAVAAGVALFTTVGVGTLHSQPHLQLWVQGLQLALWSIIAGLLMLGILPAVERVFNVQTDLSLIELGDPAHPLLQELIRRAPGTYNHSITVASLAEAAAESIGARGLLVRVGAYFHDIGKMLKPGYFVENQTPGQNRHDSLVPAMSTLVIIAHVKDGADLARQNRIPESIIDFIQQHHGTTLVEYFYRQANEKRNQDPDSAEVDESSFRYPGPKPQTKEAGVLMLADAVESASRALKEPTPSRIENVVEELAMKRLLDGQFDESGLTLEEVRKVGESLVKSLTAVYHGRVKYPEQETA